MPLSRLRRELVLWREALALVALTAWYLVAVVRFLPPLLLWLARLGGPWTWNTGLDA